MGTTDRSKKANQPVRLHFIDAIRAAAILMMLQGHFIYGLLEETYRDPDNLFYRLWLYGRGITAPLFFTASGFIFMYLLTRKSHPSWRENPRVQKGIRRGFQLIAIGYLLRLNILSVLTGSVNAGFWRVDVLQCIGLGLLFLVMVYGLSWRNQGYETGLLLLITGLLVFLFQPVYGAWELSAWPEPLANYFTRTNGSVFTLIPWLGYSAWGGLLALLFHWIKPTGNSLGWMAIAFAACGLVLIAFSSEALMWLYHQSGISLFKSVAYNNFLFIRLGNVFVLFALFLALRRFLKGALLAEIGQRTLGIYIVHFVVLYGSWFGLGLTKFFYRSLSPGWAISGAVLFILGITGLVLVYYRKKPLDGLWRWLRERSKPRLQWQGSSLKNKIQSFPQVRRSGKVFLKAYFRKSKSLS